MTPDEALDRGLAGLALALKAGGKEKMRGYMALLAKWNRTYNLTAIRDPLQVVSHHLLDSLSVVPYLPMPASGALADVGSGAGLPGIPLAIARPAWRVTVNDSNEKKTAFLRQAVMELGLGNVEVHDGRVEAWHPAQLVDVVISRAFADIGKFVTSCSHLVRPGGSLAAMKGAHPREELASGACAHAKVIPLQVPLLGAARHLVLCTPGE